jgi:hypothetical protein
LTFSIPENDRNPPRPASLSFTAPPSAPAVTPALQTAFRARLDFGLPPASSETATRPYMVHPHTELRFVNPLIGWGVFATRAIPKGTIVWALDALDQQFTPAQVAALPPHARRQLEIYSYVDGRGRNILCWDHGRFFNHSCAANCLSVGYDFELAIRDIAAGEELTDDYGTLNPGEPFPCGCASPDCRGHVRPDDMTRFADRWDAAAREAFFLIRSVPQPLWEIVRDREQIEAALAEPKRLRPIHHHYAGAPLVPTLNLVAS